MRFSSYAFASFCVLTIPTTGAFFGKRTWLMGKRYGFVTPGDMYAYYYNNEGVRFLVVATAFLYATFYSALQLTAAGALFHYVKTPGGDALPCLRALHRPCAGKEVL